MDEIQVGDIWTEYEVGSYLITAVGERKVLAYYKDGEHERNNIESAHYRREITETCELTFRVED